MGLLVLFLVIFQIRNVFDMPYLFMISIISQGLPERYCQRPGKTLKRKYRALGTDFPGKYHVSNSVRPIKTVADMKGLKIAQWSLLFWNDERTGASAIPMAWRMFIQVVSKEQYVYQPRILSIKLHEVGLPSQFGITYSPQLVLQIKMVWTV